MKLPALRPIVVMTAALVCGALVVACGPKSSTAAPGAGGASSTSAGPVALASHVPAGTTLRVGDQLDYLKTILHLAGQDKGFPYHVAYAAFVGGPPMLQAFQGGSLDTGFVGSTPLIFAQAAGQPIVAVAGWAAPHAAYGLVTKPGETDIKGWGDLKGKKVAYQQGTAGEAVLLEALDQAGLRLSDIRSVLLPQTQVSAALQGGSADAGLEVEPLTSVYLTANPTARQVARASEITDRSDFVIATEAALADPARSAALGDYLARLARAFTYLRAHPEAIIQAVYVDQYKLSPARAAQVAEQIGVASFVALPGTIGPAQQHLADLFQAAREIPKKVVVAGEFDTRFNQLVAQAQAS